MPDSRPHFQFPIPLALESLLHAPPPTHHVSPSADRSRRLSFTLAVRSAADGARTERPIHDLTLERKPGRQGK
ncbi:hypothetical protein TgHK011_005364 [Trichoderma gracile]|nr:hypothetical protein TgHK011_005364 [Trichoderma gracile]